MTATERKIAVGEGRFLSSVIDDLQKIAETLGALRETLFFKFVSYVKEKDAKDRTLEKMKVAFPEIFGESETFTKLVGHKIIWIDTDGTVRLGTLAEAFYSVLTDAVDWAK